MVSPRPRPRLLPLSVLVAALLVLGACSSGSDSDGTTSGTRPGDTTPVDEGTPVAGGNLAVGVDAESNGWDPVRSNFAMAGSMVASSIYDSLMTFDEQRQLVPNLAESVTPNDDGTVWTITVREGVTFHDGTPLDAEAVKLNIDKRTESALSAVSLEPIDSVVVVDERTVEVRMGTPWFGYDYTLAAQGGFIAAPTTLESEDGPQNPVGTGPFEFVSWAPGDEVRVTRNDDYWKTDDAGVRLPYLDGITFKVLTDPISRQSALEADDVQLITTSTSESIDALQDDPAFVTLLDRANLEATVMLNEAKPPFDNPDARRALALATDRDAVVATMGPGLLEPAAGPYTEIEQWFVDDTGFPAFDPTAAEEAVAAYEQATGAPLRFTLKATASDDLERVAELLQAQWSAVGIEVSVVPVEQSGYIGEVVVGDYEAAMFRNFSYVFPDSNYIFWHSSTAKGLGQVSVNFTQTRSEALDAALDAGRATDDPEVLAEQYAAAQRALNDELAYIWLYHQVWAMIARADVKGLGWAAEGGFARTDAKPWWPEVWISPEG